MGEAGVEPALTAMPSAMAATLISRRADPRASRRCGPWFGCLLIHLYIPIFLNIGGRSGVEPLQLAYGWELLTKPVTGRVPL